MNLSFYTLFSLSLWLIGVSLYCKGNILHKVPSKSSHCKDLLNPRSPSKMSALEDEENVNATETIQNSENDEENVNTTETIQNSENDDDSDSPIPGTETEEPPKEVTNNDSEKSKDSNSDDALRMHLVLAHGSGTCGNQECPRINDEEATCQPCLDIYQACELCKKPETHKNDKTVVISKQNEQPGAMSLVGGSFWEDPVERFHLADGNNGNVASSTPGPGPGSGTTTARAGGLLSKKILASVLISQPSRTSLRTRRGRGSAAKKEETWLVQLIKQVTDSCLLALDDTGATQYRSGLLMSADHWNQFMSGDFMTESLRVSNSLNIVPPDSAAYSQKAVDWIRNILSQYVTSAEEHSQCQELTQGEEQQNTLIRDTLKFITGTLTQAGFFGSDSNELEELLLTNEEFTIILEKFFRTMSNLWTLLVSQEKCKRSLQNKHKAMETIRANLASEINNAATSFDLDDLEPRSAEACRLYEESLLDLVHKLLVDWIVKAEIQPGIGLLTASLLFAGVEPHDPTEDLQHCPVSGDSNHGGMINYSVDPGKYDIFIDNLVEMFDLKPAIDNKRADFNTSTVSSGLSGTIRGGNSFNASQVIQDSLAQSRATAALSNPGPTPGPGGTSQSPSPSPTPRRRSQPPGPPG